MNTRWLALLKAECLRVLERAEEGLKWLSQELATDPTYWERPTVCYDLFEQIPWTEISTHWVTLYKEMCTINPQYVRILVCLSHKFVLSNHSNL